MRGHVLLSAEALQQSWARWARAGNTKLTDICIDWGDTLYAVGTPSVSPTDRSTVYEHPGYRREREHGLYLDIVGRGKGVCGHSRIWPDIVQFQYRIQNTLHSSPQPSWTGTKITTDWYLISDMYVITTSQSTYSSTQHFSAREREREREGGLLHVQPLSQYTIQTHERQGVQHTTDWYSMSRRARQPPPASCVLLTL